MSNPVLDAIFSRSSVRAFTDQPLTNEQIAQLANAALAAPTAMNRQPYQLIAVKDKALILELEKATVEYFAAQNPEIAQRNASRGNKVFYNAPVAFFIAIDTEGAYNKFDCGIVAQNLAIAATGMGLGSVILGMPRGAFLGDRAEELRMRLEFPEGYEFGLCVAVGYPDGQPKDPHPLNPAKLTLIG